MIELTKDERRFIVTILKRHLERFEKEGMTIALHDSPAFLAAEQKYDVFLRELIRKLKG